MGAWGAEMSQHIGAIFALVLSGTTAIESVFWLRNGKTPNLRSLMGSADRLNRPIRYWINIGFQALAAIGLAFVALRLFMIPN